ncbi:hypothetical protein COY28_01385 [Candidatus Woesearchaeota archaeon CG_4_10_14_0_2_um_filter_57_5]|nr:MAG: hypothetical protein AUJ68_02640 [Candidatus Woesearchaeota archaeon CG1_02_57_44]PIN70957.1 MAG: hypothetical protein COV94_00380 [Candidatus Woesearchaeota archaeon CG11_big_fil_rev_8_21_14_0_20_57_5]PIZ55939.1 MAG: hypothetical protein COY28_01385 [Candidatus Woesearchaeota archaeon CG_4_10_14_0_2_um_filter_57_5]
MAKRFARRKERTQDIASERIVTLLSVAEAEKDMQLRDRYVSLALQVKQKYKVRVPTALRERYCKQCRTYLVPGVNCRVRLKQGKRTIACLTCRRFRRVPYSKRPAKVLKARRVR